MKSSNTNEETFRLDEQKRRMELKNSEIERELAHRQNKFNQIDKKTILQWVDLEGSAAF